MAVMRNSIIFGGVDSADYGIYIGGEGTFNAPKRDAEMISIPGRNGAFALDKGRFENIEVKYSAFNYEPDLATFSANLDAFRNAICSQSGYQRLTDSFHPDEYRMATYNSGLEVKPVKYNTAAEFDIVFDCKPQRFLTSGEDPITIGEWHETETASGEIASFKAVEGDGVKSLVVDIEPYQSGSGTPSPDNVRPISGYGSVVTSVAGKNLLNIANAEIGTAWNGASNSARARLVIPVKPNTDYVLSMNGTMSVDGVYSVLSTVIPSPTTPTLVAFPKTINSGDNTYLTLGFNKTAIAQGDVDALKLQLELGTTAKFYEPYNGNTYTTSLNGTRYGGTLDVVSGVLTVTHKLVTIDSTSWAYESAYTRFYHQFSDAVEGATRVTKAISSCFESITDGRALSSVPNNAIYFGGGNRTIYIKTADYTTSSAFISAYGSQTILYPLATPQTVQLTAQEVELLVGLNQIWANSGDVAVEYGTNPNAVINPTLFEAQPMLEVEGYGTIAFNGYEIELDNAVMGEVELVSAKNWNSATWRPYLMPKEQEALYNSGDTLTLAKTIFEFALDSSNYATSYLIASATASDNNALFSTEFVRVSGSYAYFKTTISPLTFTAGTYSTITDTVTISATMKDASTKTFTVSIYFSYEAVGTEYTDIHFGTDATLPQYYYDHFVGGRGGALTVNSTVSVLGHPTYIDCDLGEAYMIKDNVPISLDAYIDLGSDLPCLAVGANEFTYDNTVTDLKVIPRWWRV